MPDSETMVGTAKRATTRDDGNHVYGAVPDEAELPTNKKKKTSKSQPKKNADVNEYSAVPDDHELMTKTSKNKKETGSDSYGAVPDDVEPQLDQWPSRRGDRTVIERVQ